MGILRRKIIKALLADPLSYRALAKEVGISFPMLNQIATGLKEPGIDSAERLLKHYKIVKI